MIAITDKRKCSGCSACMSICPVHCISMEFDNDGFKYPVADANKCINCGLCERVCPFLNVWESIGNLEIMAMKSNNSEELNESSSGGVFGGIASNILSKGGIVVGACYDSSYEKVKHMMADDLDSVKPMRGSKYIQSDVNDTLSKAKQLLDNGKSVLFSGTPCQIAGLKHYLRKDYDNLLCVEVVCHGVPSPKAWRSYLQSLDIKPCRVNMRHKTIRQGYSMFIEGSSSDEKNVRICEHHSENLYLRGFLSNLYLRPSCFACKAKNLRSHADITLGDFWTINKFSKNWSVIPELVLANTDKGRIALNELSDYQVEQIHAKSIKEIGNYIQINSIYTYKNKLFFSRIDKKDFQRLVAQLLNTTWYERVVNKLRRTVEKIKLYV